MHNLLSVLESFNPAEDYVLAMITSTQGSTYRKTGAMMLVDPQLHYWGLISGGCLEGDIQQHCAEIFNNKQDKTITYDMRGDDDLVWGMGSGCDGAIELLLKYLPSSHNHFGLFEILQQVKDGNNYQLVVGHDNQLKFQSIEDEGKHQAQTQKAWSNSGELIVPLNSPMNILICGAAPDVIPVTSIAKHLGWKTSVIDHRAEFASKQVFQDATEVTLVNRKQWQSFNLNQFDAAIVMSHHFERDQDYLARLIDSEIPYIGLLGPTARRDKLLAHCSTHFDSHEGRIFGPVGLDIGADTPATIALSIVAEIQAVKAQKQVGFCYQDQTR